MIRNSSLKVFRLAFLILAVTLACRGSVSSSGGSRVSSNEQATVNVSAQEFEFVLDATQSGPGTITFVVRNNGHMPHDFAISGNGVDEKTPMLDSGDTARLEVTLEPGTYDYVCTVPGHAILGMTGTFTVTP